MYVHLASIIKASAEWAATTMLYTRCALILIEHALQVQKGRLLRVEPRGTELVDVFDTESADGTGTGIMSTKQKELFEARRSEERKALWLWLFAENCIEDMETTKLLHFIESATNTQRDRLQR